MSSVVIYPHIYTAEKSEQIILKNCLPQTDIPRKDAKGCETKFFKCRSAAVSETSRRDIANQKAWRARVLNQPILKCTFPRLAPIFKYNRHGTEVLSVSADSMRLDGTVVLPYYRTLANNTVTDNLNYRGYGIVGPPR